MISLKPSFSISEMVFADSGQGTTLIALYMAFLCLAILAFALRLWARGLRYMQLNDWLLLIAVLFQICQSIIDVLSMSLRNVQSLI